jgi:hypothetical protein
MDLLYKPEILRNKRGQLIVANEALLYLRVKNAILQELGLTEDQLDPKTRKIIEIATKIYKDYEQFLRDSEFLAFSRAYIKYKDIEENKWKIIKTHNMLSCYLISKWASELALASTVIGGVDQIAGCCNAKNSLLVSHVLVGSDTTTASACTMLGLISPYAPTPDGLTRSWGTGPFGTSPGQGGQTYGQVTATWNPNRIPSGTIGEVGVYANPNTLPLASPNTSYGTGCPSCNGNPILLARIASADGAFSPFSYNTASPLTVSVYIYLVV